MVDLERKLNHLKELVNERINQVVGKKQPRSLYRPIQYFLEAGGKRIRPILLILSCQAVGGRLEDCLDAAAAVELLHNFTLVHDDIMDHDDTRRGRPTVHKKWDEGTAILAGDGLVALAYKSLLKTNSPKLDQIARIFTDGIIELCEGQALDKEFESRWDVTLDDYYHMIKKKTAKLLSLCCEIGAIIGKGNQEEVVALRNFGEAMGKAFQIQDDLLDILSDEKTLGKTCGSDIIQKKRTFLLIYANRVANQADKRIVERIFSSPHVDQRDILQMRDIFQRTGAIRAARETIELNIGSAREHLNLLRETPAKSDLDGLLNLISNRKF